MFGIGRKRTCFSCQRSVYDLTSLSLEDAEELLEGTPAARRNHVRFSARRRLFERRDGKVLTADCPIGARRVWANRLVTFAVLGAVASVAVAAMSPAALGADSPLPRVGYVFPSINTASPPASSDIPPVFEPPQPQPCRWRRPGQTHQCVTLVQVKRSQWSSPGCRCTPGDPLCSCL